MTPEAIVQLKKAAENLVENETEECADIFWELCSPAAVLALIERVERAEAVVSAARECMDGELGLDINNILDLKQALSSWDTAASGKTGE